MQEEWRDIKGYEGQYQVSNLGRVRSLDCIVNGRNQWGAEFKWVRRGKIRKQFIHSGTPYLFVSLKMDGKSHSKDVHRLVAEAFIPNIENKPTVNHKNHIRTDNRVENLEWATYLEQCDSDWRKKRSKK